MAALAGPIQRSKVTRAWSRTHPAVFSRKAFRAVVAEPPRLQVELHDVSAGRAAEDELIVLGDLGGDKLAPRPQLWEPTPAHASPLCTSQPSSEYPSDTLWA